MNLIDRYLYQVGRHLPAKNREDILAEIRSHLTDTLEERFPAGAQEEDVVTVLKEFGAPDKLAFSYNESPKYLIGPDLYPFFRLLAGIVLAAVIGAQLLAVAVALWIGEEPVKPLETLLSLLASIPSALGSLVIVFLILQRFGVRPSLGDEPWDPRSLPDIEESQEIKRGERIFGIAVGSVVLAVLAAVPDKLGVYIFPGGGFYPNPVLMQYIGLLAASLLVSIGLDIYLLWQGRWTMTGRIARILANLFSIVVLALLVQGHNAWLTANGSGGFFLTLTSLSADGAINWQIFGMEAFRMAFGIALVVTVVETVVLIFRYFRPPATRGLNVPAARAE